MKSLLEIYDLQVKRGDVTVLSIGKLSVKKEEVLAVVGPNGAGKSTLLLTLSRLLRPKCGEIFFNGRPLAANTDTTFRRKIALVLQDPLLFDTTVYDNVASGLRFRGVNRDEISRQCSLWLERMGVAHLSKRRAIQLSGGEAQRVNLARALVLSPELLLLDEPFSALDPPTRARLLGDLKTLLAETHTTTIFITHDISEAEILAHRMAVIIGNRLRQTGKPDQISSHPVDSQVKTFFSKTFPYG